MIFKILIFLFCTIIFVCLLNYIVNPLYSWKATNSLDIKKSDYDERVQKTNYLAYIDNNYDALLLGNSRSTYINAENINLDVRVFNYSVNAMSVYEYEQVISTFIALTNNEPKIILIGIDPFNFPGQPISILKRNFENTQTNYNRFRELMSMQVLIFSLNDLWTTYKFEHNMYDRKERYYNKDLIKARQEKNLISNEKYIKNNLSSEFNIDESLFDEYRKLVKKFPKTQFIVYNPPFQSDLLRKWNQRTDFIKLQQRWLLELIDIFGQVYFFMEDNYITEDYRNFYDTYHFYPYVGNLIADKLSQRSDFDQVSSHFGILLTKENIYNYFQKIEE